MTTRKTLEQMAQEAIRERMAEDDDIQVYQRPWVGLTEQELESAYWDYMAIATQNGFEKTVKAIEAKLKELNT